MLNSQASHPVWVRGLKHQKPVRCDSRAWSHPVWVRGLKQHCHVLVRERRGVAPRVGAWIETDNDIFIVHARKESHPVWVRGLKRYEQKEIDQTYMSHPVWVRGLKPR